MPNQVLSPSETPKHSHSKTLAVILAAILMVLSSLVASLTIAPEKAEAVDIPYVGQSFSGTCYIGRTWGLHPSYFAVSGFSGRLSGCSGTGHCITPTAAQPSGSARYTATVSSVNIEAGTVTFNVRITPPGAAYIGGPRNSLGLIGYQEVGMTVTKHEEYVGWIKIHKYSTRGDITNGNSNYSLAGAKYAVYRNDGTHVGTFTTDANGNSNEIRLAPGNYYAKETSAPKGYKLNNARINLGVVAGQHRTTNVGEDPQTASVSASKNSTRKETLGVPYKYYNFAGVQYTLRGNNYGHVYTFTLGESGSGSCSGIAFDTYTVTENRENAYYFKSGENKHIDLRTAITQGIFLTDTPKDTPPTLYKFAKDKYCQDRLDYYNYEGIEYELVGKYTKSVYNVTLDREGVGHLPPMLFDNYTIKEVKGNKYFKVSPSRDTDDVLYNDSNLPPQGDEGYYATVEIQKTSDDPDSLGTPYYNFKGIKYKLELLGTDYVTYITLNEQGWGSTANNTEERYRCVPFGRYRITEYETNEYYELNKSWVVEKEITAEITDSGKIPFKVQAAETKDHPLYGTLEIHKSSTDETTEGTEYYSFKNIVYTITGKTKGKTYDIVLNDEGWGKRDHIIFDTYSIKETVTNKYYELNTEPLDDIEISSTTSATRQQYIDAGGVKPVPQLGGGAITLKPVNLHAYYKDKPHTGELRIHKSSTNKSILKNNSHYSFEGIEYTLTGREKGEVYKLVLDANGDAVLDKIVYDTYDVKETKTNNYYKLNNEWAVSVTPDASTTSSAIKEIYITTEDEPNLGSIELYKETTDDRVKESPYYNFEGIEYKAVGQNYGNVYTFKLNADGYARVDNMEFDNYVFTETETNEWYFQNDETFECDLKMEDTKDSSGKVGAKAVVARTSDTPKLVRFSVAKITSDRNITDNNGAYSLAGAEYTITCTRDSNVGHAHSVMTTDNVGFAISDWMPYDDYRVQETHSSPGYAINPFVHEIPHYMLPLNDVYKVSEDKWNTVKEVPQGDFSFSLRKVDARTNETFPTSSASLQNCVFKIEYYDVTDKTENASRTPVRTWYVKTNSEGKIASSDIKAGTFSSTTQTNGVEVTKEFTSDEPYIMDGKVFIPVGTVVVQEVMNPVGYLYDNDTIEGPGERHVYEINGNRATDVIDMKTIGEVYVVDRPVSADFTMIKLDAETHVPMPNVPFLITSHETGEQHVAVTDADGIIDTRKTYYSNIANVNKNDAAMTQSPSGENMVANASKLDSTASVFFTGFGPKNDPAGKYASMVVPVADVQPLPFGTYSVVELPCSTNYGHSLEFFDIVVDKNGIPVFDGEVLNDVIELHTTAIDNTSGSHIGATDVDKTTIVDEIAYTNLTPGRTYKMSGTVMDKATGAPLIAENGDTFSSQMSFVPVDKDGVLRMSFEIPVSVLQNKTIVVFEALSDETRNIAAHEDLTDEGQTVRYTSIKTTATDSATGTHDGIFTEDGHAKIVDVVEYKNLIPGERYEMEGSLMDKATGKPILDENGNEIKSSLVFTPSEADGSVELSFDVTRAEVEGINTVVFEELVYKDFVVSSHKDLNDDGQTVSYPGIHTVAYDSVSGIHEGYASEIVTINDRVAYLNLATGQAYKVAGVLMDAETGEPLKDSNGKEITSAISFIAGEHSEPPVVDDESDSTADGEKASDSESNASADENGKNEVEKELTAYEELANTMTLFEQGRSSGFVTVPFEIPDSIAKGKTIVCCERLYIAADKEPEDKSTPVDEDSSLMASETQDGEDGSSGDKADNATDKGAGDNDGTESGDEYGETTPSNKTEITENDKLVITDEDITNREETVWYPSIGTTATIEGSHEGYAEPNTEIVDIVEYKNLEEGQEYKVVGKVMDKATGEQLELEGTPVTNDTAFTPEKGDGTVEVKFVIDATQLEGKRLVVFETLYKTGAGDDTEPVVVAKHEDINDDGQTVHINAARVADEMIEIADTPLALPETSDVILYSIGAVALGAVAVATLKSAQRKRRR